MKHIENKKGSWGVRGHALPENFENLRTVVAILVLFKQIFGKRYKFFAPNSKCFTKYDAFCLYIFDYACLGRKVYCYQKGSEL